MLNLMDLNALFINCFELALKKRTRLPMVSKSKIVIIAQKEANITLMLNIIDGRIVIHRKNRSNPYKRRFIAMLSARHICCIESLAFSNNQTSILPWEKNHEYHDIIKY